MLLLCSFYKRGNEKIGVAHNVAEKIDSSYLINYNHFPKEYSFNNILSEIFM